MKILSIETSCDDTAITLMEMHGSFSTRGRSAFGGKILANSSNSQIKIHAPYGGVYPMLAKREHIKNLPILLEKVLKCAKSNFAQIDLIAVTYGPGLEPSLWTGIVFAKELSEKWKIPIIPVNHMEGHIVSVFAKSKGQFSIPKINFLVLSLLVSGGHTELILSKDWLNYKIIGETLDDAAGEAYDKVARMMNLPYPGGPKISKLAEKAREKEKLKRKNRSLKIQKGPAFSSFSLPRPMLYSKNFDFSFSGLKTAVLYLIRDLKKENPNILPTRNASSITDAGGQNDKIKQAIALEFENAVVETLIYKTTKAKEKYKAKTIIVAGGVACNKHLQREMKKAVGKDIKLLFPEKELTGDNSIMIGMAGYLQFIKNNKKVPKISSIKANGNLRLK
ncbi:tRNA (adenosine(37)-N6)-threonylcarbamoyltransferase complex transferase subunit TsaD [Candidatus Nomurabacteria bacterium CG_4_9_14_0_2_um_filter_32_10]|uniref:tRNA N6-adenosine threonylcarbamoyltransferase n=1 Tax=Candidatus Nomurabacteria bacterium CG_4_9_14_0_2_um_filter_32_10 TaxID=1974729 RepID=A0A2J0N3J7_9BACT|nr:MAG: tRNA (adenosine(37)-N6)-threonylcarbamoyltransferase complex transferase subunit TsaD [Candidatus Nomurabacteria bacterium CG_4_9_14_0_2_um_filter_32_10]